MITVSEVMASAGIDTPESPMQDAWYSVVCPGCSQENQLSALELREAGDTTEYVCQCGTVAVLVHPSPPPGIAPPLGGYRLGPTVVNPRGVMLLRIPGAESALQFPPGESSV